MGRGLSVSACSSPPSRYRFPTRETSRGYPPTATAVALTEKPWLSISSVRIRRNSRAESRTPVRFALSAAASDSVRVNPVNRVFVVIPGCRSNPNPDRKPAVIGGLWSEH